MIVCAILILVLTDFQISFLPVNAAQYSTSSLNDVGNKLKRDTEEGWCVLPSQLENGQYSPSHRRCSREDSTAACRMVPGTSVPPQWIIFYVCDPGYKINTTKTVSVCLSGRWAPALPSCVESHYDSDSLPSREVCGKSAQQLITKRQTDGTVAAKGAWPWMVIFGVRKNVTNEIHWFCAGTLITTRHILTAAHCVADYRRRPTFIARLDDVNLDDTSDDNGGALEVIIQRNNIVVHPEFRRDVIFSHNIAIVKLTSDLSVTDFIRPICLPTPDFLGRKFTNTTAYFTSWGQTDNDREWNRKRKHQPVLQEIKATIADHHICNYNYKNYQSEDFVIISWDLICAAVPSNKNCQGDAGSPLMLKMGDRYVLIGIVATPFRCYDELFPRLFTRMSEYMDWIIANLKF